MKNRVDNSDLGKLAVGVSLGRGTSGHKLNELM
jgi:hypothetical protein